MYVDGIWKDEPIAPEDTDATVGVLSNIEEPYKEVQESEEARAVPTYGYYDEQKVSSELGEQVDFKDSSEYIKPSATVAGQLSSLLSSDSKYIQQARLGAQEQAQERGMLNTSMASGAGEAAAIQSALPIAQQDAQTFATSQQMKQGKEYDVEYAKSQALISSEMVEQEAKITAENQKIQNTFNVQMTSADANQKVWLADLQSVYNKDLQTLQFQQEQLLADQNFSAVTAQGIRDSSSAIMQNYQISVENLMTDPDFLQLGATAVNKAVNELQVLAKNSINFVGASNGVDLSMYVDTYIGDLRVM